VGTPGQAGNHEDDVLDVPSLAGAAVEVPEVVLDPQKTSNPGGHCTGGGWGFLSGAAWSAGTIVGALLSGADADGEGTGLKGARIPTTGKVSGVMLSGILPPVSQQLPK